ncbi:adhesion G-protein coupled receptor G5-like [Syngnathoides biaculeatus]|uniref:adhesion G-protein coupled receptor G5-like n=1 Tax=Syngnathoides biaculeatus TaxID=300417 RepID=UPI002ADDEC4E|nr:adhesion G-protein coupled receptor G5-like [Syngnathoides biaculeatus]
MRRWLLAWPLAFLACCNGLAQNGEGQHPIRGDNPDPGGGRGSEECPDGSGPDAPTGGIDCDNEGLRGTCRVSGPKRGLAEAKRCMEHFNEILDSSEADMDLGALQRLEKALERTEVNETTSMFAGRVVALLFKPKEDFTGLHISASDSKVEAGTTLTNGELSVRLPPEALSGSDDTVLFCMVTWPRSAWNATREKLYQERLLSLSVRGKTVSGLRERVNITVNATALNETQRPKCVFLNFSTKAFSDSGCRTIWEPGQSHVTCSCDHLTYFGILLASTPPSPANEAVLSYLSLIGCSLSLVALVVTLLLFITKRQIREDVSTKVHANLAAALILLNAHFLSSQAAALSSERLCVYVALALHYSLLATFSWMALESFHLYLLLVRVFNIYIRRYMLKMASVGWSVPAAIVILVVAIRPDAYGRVALDATDPGGTQICFLMHGALKTASTLGVFSVVFAFNAVMFAVTVRRLIGHRYSEQLGQDQRGRAKRSVVTLLGVGTLLGVTWGLIFFSFGHLRTGGLYLFCILNSLQGFFIFLWFVMSLRKSRSSTASSKTPSAST